MTSVLHVPLVPNGAGPSEFMAQLRSALESEAEGKIGSINLSGITPTEFKVLIAPKEVADKIGSILLPDQKRESDKFATTEGSIVAISHLAFTYASPEEWGEHKPKPGDQVVFAKYAGLRVTGRDGKEYILANDKDVVAITS